MSVDNEMIPLDLSFRAEITRDKNSGWPCVQMPNSAELLGTGKAIRVLARISGSDYEATMLPVGNGVHMLPLRANFRREHALEVGQHVDVQLQYRKR